MPSDPPSLPADVLIEHQDFLRALARGLLGDAHRADDAVQDAFASAIESPPRDPAGARSWLSVVVRNHARNLLRGDARRVDRERAVARPEATEDDTLQRMRVQRRVLEALERLREPYRTAVFLRYAEGLPPREIARRTESNVETVRSRVQRGLELLRRDLDDEFGERGTWSALLVPLAVPRTPAAGSTPFVGACIAIALLCTIPVALHFAHDGDDAVLATLPAVRPWVAETTRRDVAPIQRPAAIQLRAVGSEREALDDARALAPDSRATRITDARGRPLAGVRIGSSDASDSFGVATTSLRENEAFDVASAAQLVLLEQTIEPDGTRSIRLDVPVEIELDADPGELDGVVLTLADAGGVVVATSRPHIGTRPFVRFARAPSPTLLERDGGASWTLFAANAEGSRRAEQRVHAVRGLAGEPVRLEFSDAACFVVRATSSTGTVLDDAHVELDGADLERTGTTFSAVGRRPGSHSVLVRAPRHAPRRVVIDAVAGSSVHDIVLEPRAEYAVEFRVVSAAARADFELELALHCAAEPDLERSVLLRRGPDGRTVDRGADLPAGTWTAVARGAGPWPFDPPSAEFTVPGPGPRFVRNDAEAALPVVVRARDERGRPIARVRCGLLVDRHDMGKRAAYHHESRVPVVDIAADGSSPLRVLANQRFHWLVEADGRMSRYGDEREARRVGDHFEIDVELADAWRLELWIAGRDESGSVRPIDGARLATVSGRELARSLADGRIVLELPYDPGQLELEHDGWRVAAWEGFANGRRRAELPLHRALLEREP